MKNHKTLLECDHVRYVINAILTAPMVVSLCAISVTLTSLRFLAGFTLGVWFSMWLVVLWAWLVRRQLPREKND